MSSDAPSFARNIAGLFRDDDVEAMEWDFDLPSYEDVKTNAEAILERLEDGSMPCDGEWPEERIATFRAWIDAGSPG